MRVTAPKRRPWSLVAPAALVGSLGVFALASAAPAAPAAPRPPRVAAEAATGAWGGGSPEAAGHGRRMQEQGAPSTLEELADEPPWHRFYAAHVRRNRPVVLRGAARRQHAFSKWSDQYLAQHWGQRSVNVEVNKSETRGGPNIKMRFGEFLTEMHRTEQAGMLYAIVDFDQDNTAKADFDLPKPIRCQEVLPQSLTLWISSGGTTSVLHQDDAENVLLLLAGRKTVMLVHQDEAQKIYAPIAEHQGTSPVHQDAVDLVAFPEFANVSWIYGEVFAGDMLYIPHTYWHQVNSFERNLAVNLWWQHTDDWRWWDPRNDREYDAMRFGSPGWVPFDELKSRSAAAASCTPLPSGKDLSAVRFMDEDRFKEYAAKMRRKARKRGEL